jgi:hypothetical protein
MGSLTRQQLLRKRKVRKVLLPEMAVKGADHVYVRSLNASEAMALHDIDDKQPVEGLVRMCLAGMCDKQGTPLFSAADCDKVAELPFTVLNRCAEALMELNELTEDGSAARKKD